MVYTHPMQAYISNFQRERNIPASAVFQTWSKVYQLIEDYIKMTKGNFSLFVNIRKEFAKDIKDLLNISKDGLFEWKFSEFNYKFLNQNLQIVAPYIASLDTAFLQIDH